MPDSDDPNVLVANLIEEAVRRDDDFPVRKALKLGNNAAGLREFFEPSQGLQHALAETCRRAGIIASNVREGREELFASGSRKADGQSVSSARRASAAAMTSSRL